jgi:hypothetical protein
VVLSSQRRRRPPYTGKVLKEKTDDWHHGVSPPSRQQRVGSLTDTLRSLVDIGLGAVSILANLHHWRIVPLMEREICIYEMSDATKPTALARSPTARTPSPGVCSHEGEVRHQPQVRAAPQR